MSNGLFSDDKQELLTMAAEGRECEIALKVFDGMLDSWRDDVISRIESVPLDIVKRLKKCII